MYFLKSFFMRRNSWISVRPDMCYPVFSVADICQYAYCLCSLHFYLNASLTTNLNQLSKGLICTMQVPHPADVRGHLQGEEPRAQEPVQIRAHVSGREPFSSSFNLRLRITDLKNNNKMCYTCIFVFEFSNFVLLA